MKFAWALAVICTLLPAVAPQDARDVAVGASESEAKLIELVAAELAAGEAQIEADSELRLARNLRRFHVQRKNNHRAAEGAGHQFRSVADLGNDDALDVYPEERAVRRRQRIRRRNIKNSKVRRSNRKPSSSSSRKSMKNRKHSNRKRTGLRRKSGTRDGYRRRVSPSKPEGSKQKRRPSDTSPYKRPSKRRPSSQNDNPNGEKRKQRRKNSTRKPQKNRNRNRKRVEVQKEPLAENQQSEPAPDGNSPRQDAMSGLPGHVEVVVVGP